MPSGGTAASGLGPEEAESLSEAAAESEAAGVGFSFSSS